MAPVKTSDVELVAVAAIADNRVIGDDGELPWPSIPEDREQYRERVAGFPVILGRRTFESMRADLPGLTQIVLSRSNPEYDEESVVVVDGDEPAVDIAETLGAERAYVLGGGAIYALFQPHIDRMVLSRVPGEYDGDTRFPDWDANNWILSETTEYDRFTLEEWVRTGDRDGA